MISAGVEGRLPYMTYPEPWRGPPKQPPELFLRPAPKPLSQNRYNGVNTTNANGTRLAPIPPRPISKYPSPPTPVNLVQPKEELSEEMDFSSYMHLYPQQFPHFPYMYNPQSFMIRPNFPTTPLSPLETYSPTTPTASSASTFLSPPAATFSPPSAVKPGQSILRDKRTPPSPHQPQAPSQHVAFKVPSGKEGSLKHRILTRPEDAIRGGSGGGGPLDLQKQIVEGRKRLPASTMSPPRSPKIKPLNNNTVPGNFAKGSLIQLASGEFRKIEDMRTEDFVSSAEKSPELRLAESTVLKINESPITGNASITLTYNQNRAQVEVESTVEHPYFVMGHGWASCNPTRTHQCYGYKVHRLQVGDILISLTPREVRAPPISMVAPPSPRVVGSTIMTTATTTAMTTRQVSLNSATPNQNHVIINNHQSQPINLHAIGYHPPQSMSPDRKRRWSAPDQICDEDDQQQQVVVKRHRAD